MNKGKLLSSILSIMVFPSLLVAQDGQVQRIGYDFSQLYESLNPSIVKIHADNTTGSGSLVSPKGLIATNHHVVANSRYLAVEFSDGRKFRAEVVVLNPRYDLAILKVNSSLVASLRPLALLPKEKDSTVKAGIPVIAFGSPLSQTFLMTQGIVSKVEENVLLGDFLIRPGNSGGPLVNLKGEVIGINTFLLSGISGAVRVGILRDTLTRPDVEKNSQEEPPADPLPTVNPRRYPTEILKAKILEERLDWSAYRFDGGKFVVTVITPVLVGKAQVQDDLIQAANRYKRRGKKIKDPSYQPIDEPFYEWHRNAMRELDYVVRFEVKPDFGLTTGSKWAVALTGISAGLGNRNAAQNLHLNMEFKAEFLDFKLYRDGELIQPIHPGRAITESSFDSSLATFVDEAYSGVYVYAPEAFMIGNEFQMDIYDAREPEKVHKTIKFKVDSKLIKQIRSDFANTSEK
jgi:hypothetical protein